MKSLSVLSLCLFCTLTAIDNSKAAGKSETFTVFQLNLWHGGTKVPEGYDAILNLLDRIDADVVFLCEIRDKNRFIPQIIADLKSRGKKYYGEETDSAIGIISKYAPEDIERTCIVPGDEGRAMIKITTTIAGQPFAFYSCHLDYTHYECYMPRGYSGTTWKKIAGPISDEATVLAANRLSFRDESIAAFVKESAKEIEAGRIVIMGGDFNEPSHLDWQANTRNLWDHNGAVINWDCSVMLHQAGFTDSFRKKYPDAAKYPGFTFPAGNKVAEEAGLERLAWAPDADERDRIDFIYYHPAGRDVTLKNAELVGPSETVIRGKIETNDAKDKFIAPDGTWPTDHKGNLATFRIKGK